MAFHKKLIEIINEINKVIDFTPAINVHAKYLEKELRVNTAELCIDDREILTPNTWEFLREGDYIDHIPYEDVKTQEKEKKRKPQKKIKSSNDTMEQLIHVAKNINKVLGLSPPIHVSNDKKLLFSHVKEAAMEIYKEDEEPFDDDAWEYLQQNGLIDHVNIGQKQKIDEEPRPKKEKKQSKSNTSLKKEKKKKPGKERLARIEDLIKIGLHTNSQIAVIVEKEFEMYALSGTLALISNAKNPKYTKFKQLAITDPITKILSFEED